VSSPRNYRGTFLDLLRKSIKIGSQGMKWCG